MRMLHASPNHDLTYNDVFMVPSLSAVRVAPRRRSHHTRRRRHHDPARGVEHDCRGRSPHGRGGRPPRWRRRAPAGHPRRRDRDRGQVRQGLPSRVRDADHVDAEPHDRRCARAGVQARPRRSGRDRLRRASDRCVHRARRGRLRPLHPIAERDEQRPGDARRRHRPGEGVRDADPGAPVDGAGDRRRRPPAGRAHVEGRVALDDLPPSRRRRRATPHLGRGRHQRRSGWPRRGARRDGCRHPRHRHRPRPPDKPSSRSSSRCVRPFRARRSSPATS